MTFNYITGRVADAFTVAGGARLGFFSGKVDNLLEDMQILKPTLFNTVPRLLNRIYTGMYSLGERNSVILIHVQVLCKAHFKHQDQKELFSAKRLLLNWKTLNKAKALNTLSMIDSYLTRCVKCLVVVYALSILVLHLWARKLCNFCVSLYLQTFESPMAQLRPTQVCDL